MPTIADVEVGIEKFLDKAIPEESSELPDDDDDEVSESPDVEDEESAKPTSKAEESESEDIKIETLEQLAEGLGMTMEELEQAITTKTKIDKEERSVSLADLKAGFQKGEAYEQRKAKLQEERSAFENEAKSAREGLTQRMQQTMQMGQYLESQLIGAMNEPQMRELRAKNPGEYAAVMQEMNLKRQQLHNALQYQANEIRKQQEAVSAETKKARESLLAQETALLREKLPNFNAEQARKYMQGLGFSESQMDIDNHLWLVLADKAMKFDEAAKKGDVVKKKVVELPKLQKPGKTAPVQASKVAELRNRLKKTGSGKDFASIIEHQLNKGRL